MPDELPAIDAKQNELGWVFGFCEYIAFLTFDLSRYWQVHPMSTKNGSVNS